MLLHYLKLAGRALFSNKLSVAINVMGLSIGLGASVILLLWIQKEYQYNRYLPSEQEVYQSVISYPLNGDLKSHRAVSAPVVQLMEHEVAGIQATAYIQPDDRDVMLRVGDRVMQASGRGMSSNFFQVIHRPFLYGDPKDVLADPISLVLSKSMAMKLFGDNWKQRVQEETVTMDGFKELDVVGVFEDFPELSTLRFDYGLRLEVDPQGHIGNYNYETYVRMQPGADPQSVARQVNLLLKPNTAAQMLFQPFQDIHLYSNFRSGQVDGGRIEYVQLFLIAAVFILVMASINFMNLFTASAFRRTKEIATKRLLGGRRVSLVVQLLCETYLITLIAIVLALLLIYLSLPRLNSMLGDNISIPVQEPGFWTALLALLVVTGLVSGIYPALLLTSVKPVNILTLNQEVKLGGVGLRKVMFAFQFFVSVLLIFFTFGVTDQLSYLRHKDLGFNKKNILCKKLSPQELEKLELIKTRLRSQSYVRSVTSCSDDLQSGSPMVGNVEWPNKNHQDSTRFGVIFGDEEFVKTLGIEVSAGSFSKQTAKNNIAVLINEKAAAIMGGRDNILNNPVTVWGSEGLVTGIVKDFHFNSLFTSIEPLIIALVPDQSEYLIVRIQDGHDQEALDFLQQLNREFNIEVPFSYYWMEDSLDRLYANESNMMRISTLFSVLSLVIAALGLFGIAHFTIERRVRELSIRKILGASFGPLIYVVFRDFLRLMAAAVLLAMPLSYLLFEEWAAQFPYKSPLSVSSYLFPVLLMVVIFSFTILYHAVRVLYINPINTLREK